MVRSRPAAAPSAEAVSRPSGPAAVGGWTRSVPHTPSANGSAPSPGQRRDNTPPLRHCSSRVTSAPRRARLQWSTGRPGQLRRPMQHEIVGHPAHLFPGAGLADATEHTLCTVFTALVQLLHVRSQSGPRPAPWRPLHRRRSRGGHGCASVGVTFLSVCVV